MTDVRNMNKPEICLRPVARFTFTVKNIRELITFFFFFNKTTNTIIEIVSNVHVTTCNNRL